MNNKLQETLDFIYQVKDRPALWFQGHYLHSDKVVCDALWESIGSRFHIPGPNAKSRWKNLRDNFRRELRRSELGLSGNTAEEYNSPWRYFQHMFFIKDQLRQTNTSAESTSQNNTSKKFEPTPSTSKANGNGIIMDDEIEVVETTHDAFVTEFKKAAPPPQPKVTKSRREDSKRRKLEKQIAEAMLASVDADVGYLACLLPHIRSVPLGRKALMKHHLLEVLVQYLDDADIEEAEEAEVFDETSVESGSDESEVSNADHEEPNETTSPNNRKRKLVHKPEQEGKRTKEANFSSKE